MKNWKTYLAAGLAILIAVCTCAYALLDGDPETSPDISATVKAVTDNLGTIRNAREAAQ